MPTSNTVNRRALLGAGLSALAMGTTGVSAKGITSDIAPGSLKSSKTTKLGLYLSPAAAHQALQDNPEILFVDVRDPIEISFVGHPHGLDKIIPLQVATHMVSPQTGQYHLRGNPDVVSDFEALLARKSKTKDDPIFLTCRSGNRSAVAAGMLIAQGYTNVWNLTEGFEGDRAPDGSRSRNGWRNHGLPWAYKLEKGVAWEG